ncbi:MAG: DMT family transporter [Rhodobacteraceae bacterium]|nr:DMT family transporter [Paracoccaceae bacterium]
MCNGLEKTHPAGRPLLGIALLVAALQLLPISDAGAKWASVSLPLLQVIWARFFFHCVLTGAYSAYRYGPKVLVPRLASVVFLRGAALFATVGLFYVTLRGLPMTTTLTLWFVSPFVLTLLAVLVFREMVSPVGWCAVGVGFSGILIANPPDLVALQWAYLTGAAAGCSYAVFLLMTRILDEDLPPAVSVYQTGLVGCIASTAIVITLWVSPTPRQWIILVAIGLIAALAHLLIIRAFQQAEASLLAPFTYSEVIAAAVLDFAVFGNVPTNRTVLGLALIVASAIVIAVRTKPKGAAPTEI